MNGQSLNYTHNNSNFTSFMLNNYNIIPDANNRTQFAYNQKTKNLALSTNRFTKYMTTYNDMSHKPRFILPKIKMLPDNCYDPVNTMPAENIFFKYKLNRKKDLLKQQDKAKDKEDLLDSLTSASQMPTEYSSLRIYPQNKEPLMSNILTYLNSKLNLGDNSTFNKAKTIKNRKSQIDLEIESISLIFKKKGIPGTHKVIFPFDFLPFFYAINNNCFLFFLSKVIKISTDITKISIDFADLRDMVAKFIQFAVLFKSDSHLYKNIIHHAANWHYDWIVYEHIIQMSIELPTVQCVLYGNNSKQKVKFIKVIEPSYVVELLKENFIQWDQSMLFYLSQYKNFRTYAKEVHRSHSLLLSKQIKSINLDNVSPLCDLNQEFYDFFITSKDESYYIKLYSYQFEVNINFKANESSSEFIIPTCLQDLYKLEILKDYFDLNQLVKKCLVINRYDQSVTLNSDLFKTIDESILPKRNNPEAILNINKRSQEDINITAPRIHWKIFGRSLAAGNADGIKIMENTSELDNNLVSALVVKPVYEWSSAIQAHQKSFESDLNLFCSKRRSSLCKKSSIKKKAISRSPTIVIRNKKNTKKKSSLINLIVV